jgi:outer membrane protein assembly factor BamB
MKVTKASVTVLAFGLILMTFLPLAASAAAPALDLKPLISPPTKPTVVTGTGFGPSEAVDIFFDTYDLALAVTDAAGDFSCRLNVPASAHPGTHWVTGIGRHSGLAAQKSLTVRTDWKQFRYNSSHTGFNPLENVISSYNIRYLTQAWAAKIGDYGKDQYSSPAVANGKVYVGSTNGKLYAFASDTGVKIWDSGDKIGGPIRSSPAVDGTRVFVGSDDKKLYAFNANTGAKLWDSSNSVTLGGSVISSPAVAYGLVYVGSMDGHLCVFQASTGILEWYSGVINHPIWSSPAVTNGRVFVGVDDSKLYAYNAFTGGLWLWHSGPTFTNAIYSSPAVVGGRVCAIDLSGTLATFKANADEMVKIWSVPPVPLGGTKGSPAVANGMVFVGNSYGVLCAFDLVKTRTTGKPVWVAMDLNTSWGGVDSSPVVANELVYVGTDNGVVYAFDIWNGNLQWSATTGNKIISSPAVANGNVYVSSSDGYLYCYNLEAGYNGPALKARRAAAARPPDLASLVPDYSLEPQEQF